MLGEDRQQAVVLTEDRVDERVEEQVRAVDPEMVEQVLHASAGTARERAMAQRFILRALLADDQHLDLLVAETAAVEHRPEVPTELLVARHGDAGAARVRCFGEQPRPTAVLRRPRVVLPGRSTILPVLLPHGGTPVLHAAPY